MGGGGGGRWGGYPAQGTARSQSSQAFIRTSPQKIWAAQESMVVLISSLLPGLWMRILDLFIHHDLLLRSSPASWYPAPQGWPTAERP